MSPWEGNQKFEKFIILFSNINILTLIRFSTNIYGFKGTFILLFGVFELEVEVLKGLKTFESFLKLYLWYLGSSLALKCKKVVSYR